MTVRNPARAFRRWLCLLVASMTAWPAGAQDRDWDAMAAIPFSDFKRSVAVADFDGDGRLDVATSSPQGIEIRLVRRDDGQSSDAVRVGAAAGTRLAAADLDGDGDADLVMGGAALRVYWGDGRAGFAEFELTGGASETFEDLALFDMNGDGLLDVVAPSSMSGLYVVPQDRSAASGFAPPFVHPQIGTSAATRLAVADFDADGFADAALVAAVGRIAYGDGAGGFSRVVEPAGLAGSVVAPLDFDADGRVDLAIGFSQSVHLHRNDPASSSFTLARTVHVGRGVFSTLDAGDFDADGFPDLLVGFAANDASAGLHVLYGRRRAPGPRPLDSLLRSSIVDDAVVVDFDRDGFLDAVALLRGFVAVARGSAAGPKVPTSFAARDASQLATADFDGDGRLDLAVGVGDRTLEFGFWLLRIDEGGRLQPIARIPTRNIPSYLAAGDFNADGRPDLVSASDYGRRVALLIGSGTGFDDAGDLLRRLTPGVPIVADFDGNGTDDVVVGTTAVVFVLLGDGAGAFPSRLSFDGASETLHAGDVDEDGRQDVVFRNPSNGRHYVIHGDPAGLRGPEEIALPADVSGLSGLLDFDGDGHVDLLFGESSLSETVHVLFGDGNSGFSRRASIPLGTPIGRVRVADVNGDGRLDIVNHRNLLLSVFLDDGGGGYARPLAYAQSGSLTMADLDGDGLPDAAAADPFGDAVNVVLPRLPDPREALVGTVNRKFDSPANVLFVNDGSGGAGRRLRLLGFEPIVAYMATPPRATSVGVPFALYAWEGEPAAATARSVPLGLGTMALPPPFMGGFPRAIWNSTDRPKLGAPTAARSPLAPGVVFRKPSGAGRAVTFTLQGIIADPGSRGERPASVTNGIVVEVR